MTEPNLFFGTGVSLEAAEKIRAIVKEHADSAGATVRTVVYVRISQDSEEKGLGVMRQLADCLSLLQRKTWKLAAVYVENDVSATRKKGVLPPRPVFDLLIEGLLNKTFDALVGWEADRLFRDPLEQEQFILLCERHKVHKIATVVDEIDIESGEGLMVWRIKTAVAAEETRKMGKRIRSKMAELAEAGLHKGGPRPFGFEKDGVTHRESEANLIREAADRIEAGESLGSIARDWNQRGIPTATGNARWNSTNLKRVIVKGRNAGLREQGVRAALEGEGAVSATTAVWEPIFSVEQLEAIRLKTGGRSRPANTRNYLLTGLIHCGMCGAKMAARPNYKNGERTRRYHCWGERGGCNKNGIDAQHAEGVVAEAAFLLMENLGGAQETRDDEEQRALLRTIEADEAKLRELAGMWADGDLSREEWKEAKGRIEERVKANRTQVQTVQLPVELDRARERWNDMTFDEKQAAVRVVVEEVVIGPATLGRKFDSKRISVVSTPSARRSAPGASEHPGR